MLSQASNENRLLYVGRALDEFMLTTALRIPESLKNSLVMCAQIIAPRPNGILRRRSPCRSVALLGMLLLISMTMPVTMAQAEDVFTPIDIRHIQVEGEIGRRIEVTIENNVLAIDVDKDFLRPFQKQNRQGGFIGLGMHLDSLVRFAAYNRGDQIVTHKKHVVTEIIKTQGEDGYLGIMKPEARIWKLWDVHEMSYLILGLTSDHRYFGEEPSLEAARKIADYIMQRWSAEPKRHPSDGALVDQLAVIGIGSAMLSLYRETGEIRYLEFCTDFLKIPDWNEQITLGRSGKIDGHIYAYMSRCLAQLRSHRVRPIAKHLDASLKALEFLTRRDGLVITGACGVSECWHDTQEGTGDLGETCSTAYLIRWLDNWLCLEGDPQRGDIMERAIYNALFAAQSPDGRLLRYYSPFAGSRKFYDKDTYCCPNNYRRIISELPGMIYYRSAGGAMINLYTPSTATLELDDDVSLDLRQETDYPNTGQVVIHVSPSQRAEFSLQLRIPNWCSEATIAVNGKPHGVVGPGFTTIERTWEAGDKVELNMPMPWRLVRGRKSQVGRVAVMRGPLLFCLNRKRHPELADINPKTLVLDPSSLEGPVVDDSVRPGGIACRVRAWRSGADYSSDTTAFELTLTEFPDPDGVAVYFSIPNPKAEEVVDDELLQH